MKLTIERKAALIASGAVVATPFLMFGAAWLWVRHPLAWAAVIGIGGLGGLWWILYGTTKSSLELREIRRAAAAEKAQGGGS